MKGFNVYTEFFCTVCFPTYVFPVFWSWLHECKQYITMHGHYRHPPGFVSRLIVSSLRSWNTSDPTPDPPSHLCRCSWFSSRVVFEPAAPPCRRLYSFMAQTNVFTRPEALIWFFSSLCCLFKHSFSYICPWSCFSWSKYE